MKSTEPIEEIKNNYLRWHSDANQLINDVDYWQKELNKMRKDLDHVRQEIVRHSKVLEKHKDLLNLNKDKIQKKIDKIRTVEEVYIDRLCIAHQKEIEQNRFQKLAHDNIRKRHTRLLATLSNETKGLE